MSAFARVVVVVAVLLASVACAGDEPESTAGRASTTTTVASGPELNERGHLVRRLGEEAGIGDGSAQVRFAIDAILVDPPCGEAGTKPAAGHTLLLALRVVTGDHQDTVHQANAIINKNSFSVLGADGVAQEVEPGLCTSHAGGLTDEFQTDHQYTGTIEVVAPVPSGQLILHAPDVGGTDGWEWSY